MSKLLFDKVDNQRILNKCWNLLVACSLLLMLVGIILIPTNSSSSIFKLKAIFPPLILAGSLYLYQQFRYWKKVSRLYHNTTYSVHPKRKRNPEPPMRELKTIRNRIIYRVTDQPNYEGEIVLDLFNLRYGKGFHHVPLEALNDKNNVTSNDPIIDDRFGFSQFILSNDKIYVENPYIKPSGTGYSTNGSVVNQACIWEKVN